MSGQAGDADGGGDGRIGQIASLAKFAGKSVVLPMLKGLIRDEVVKLLNENDPEELRNYITVQYPLVEQDLPPRVKQAMRKVGPRFADDIEEEVTTENILSWLEDPDEHVDMPDAEAEQVQACADIIRETPGGEEWLENQVRSVWQLCGVL
jgi:hypothetical protein